MQESRIPTIAVLLALFPPTVAGAQSIDNVLVVVNANSPASVEIGTHYLKVRKIRSDQMVRLRTAVVEEVSRPVYARQIEVPISRWLQLHKAQDRILYIVLTKGVPLRIVGSAGRAGTLASVDSELTLLYRKMTGIAVPPGGRVSNPYFLDESDVSQAPRFSHEKLDIYLVTRLDGFTVGDVFALIDRGVEPASDGQIVLDQRMDPSSHGDRWLEEAADLLAGSHGRVRLEGTTRGATGQKQVLGYYSWGTADPALLRRKLNHEFVPGALAATYVGTSARTFREPPADWRLGTWTNRDTFFGSSPEGLLGGG